MQSDTGLIVVQERGRTDFLYIESEPQDVLRLLECTIKKLNQKNNEIQQYICTNKDKSNKFTVEKLHTTIRNMELKPKKYGDILVHLKTVVDDDCTVEDL